SAVEFACHPVGQLSGVPFAAYTLGSLRPPGRMAISWRSRLGGRQPCLPLAGGLWCRNCRLACSRGLVFCVRSSRTHTVCVPGLCFAPLQDATGAGLLTQPGQLELG